MGNYLIFLIGAFDVFSFFAYGILFHLLFIVHVRRKIHETNWE